MFGNYKFNSILKHPGYNKGKGGGGGGAQNTTATTYTTNIPEYAKPYVQSMLGAAQSEMFNIDDSGNITGTKPYVPYSTNPEDYVAGFSPLQQTSFNRAAGLGVPSQFGQATQLGGAAGLGSLGLAGQAANAGQQFQQMATNPNAIQAYMNPYLESSLAPQLEAMRREYGKTATEQQSRATAAGAFGGSREALMAAENERAKNAAMDVALKQGYNNAFQNAQNQMQFGSTLGLQGLGTGLSGLGQAGNIAAGLGNLGTNQLAAQQGIINTQNLLGTQQQQQQQNIINQAIQDYATAQQYPMMQLGNMSNLLRGLPMQSTSTQTYQAAPSMLSQVAGLGTGIAGAAQLMKAEGGTVKSYAGGGITSLQNRMNIAENYNPQMINQSVQRGVLPQGIGDALKQDYNNLQGRSDLAKAAQVAQQAVQNMPPENAGIDSAPTNIAQMAGGGIVAFSGETGSQVKERKPTYPRGFVWDPVVKDYDTSGAQDLLNAARNPATGKEWTPAEVDAMQAARREERGIKDIYTGQMEEVKKDQAALEGQKDRALGLSLLSASGKMLGSTSPFALAGIGEGLGEFSTKYGSALDKLDANKLALRKEQNGIMAAQQGMKEAQLAGDDAKFKSFEDKYENRLKAYQDLQNKNVELRNQVNLEGSKAGADYKKSIDVANINASTAGAAAANTDLKFITRGQYDKLIAAGEKPGPETMAKAQTMAADIMGKVSGGSKMDLETIKLDLQLADHTRNAVQKALDSANSPLAMAQTDLMKAMASKDPAKIAAAQTRYDTIENRIITRAKSEFAKVKIPDITQKTPEAPAEVKAPEAPKYQNLPKQNADGSYTITDKNGKTGKYWMLPNGAFTNTQPSK